MFDFYKSENEVAKNRYKMQLKLIGSLSNLFSDSTAPYLHYRIAEKLFCMSFDADDLSRGDVAIDAKKGNIGIGLKTFLQSNNKSFQKIAEFNKDKTLYDALDGIEKIRVIAHLRNERIKFTNNVYQLDKNIYHCIVRNKNTFSIFEEQMDLIDIENIKKVTTKKSSITFSDTLHEYSFNLSKSTLTKRFITDGFLDIFNVKILENPLEDLSACFNGKDKMYGSKIEQTIFLPLYGSKHKVYTKSGLNQWNAKGRKRDYNEVYIPIPSVVHTFFPNFFPDRDIDFNLVLPNKKFIISKVCQENAKALMSKKNKELGRWILRDILNLQEGELLDYNKLQVIGIDSIKIDKINNETYEINFAKTGSYDTFFENNLV